MLNGVGALLVLFSFFFESLLVPLLGLAAILLIFTSHRKIVKWSTNIAFPITPSITKTSTTWTAVLQQPHEISFQKLHVEWGTKHMKSAWIMRGRILALAVSVILLACATELSPQELQGNVTSSIALWEWSRCSSFGCAGTCSLLSQSRAWILAMWLLHFWPRTRNRSLPVSFQRNNSHDFLCRMGSC